MIRPFADDGDLSGQYGGRHEMHADLAHPFGDAWQFTGADSQSRVRCLVATGRPGSAGREDQRTAIFIDQFVQGFFDLFTVVRYQTGFEPIWRCDRMCQPVLQCGNAQIGVSAVVGTIRYGNDIRQIKKSAKKEMKKLFGDNYKYKLEYGERYPLYVYRPAGNTIVFNSMRIPGKDSGMKIEKIIEYAEGKYRVVAEAYLKSRYTGQKEKVQRYTILVDKQEDSEFGYVVNKLRLYKKNDKKVKR